MSLNEIAFVKYETGAEYVLYNGLNVLTEDVSMSINRLVSDKELETIQKLPIEELKTLVSNILEGKGFDILK